MNIKNHVLPSLLLAMVLAKSAVTYAEVDVSKYGQWQDILTPQQAKGRFDWLERCYSGVLVEVWERMYDVTDLITKEEKIAQLKTLWLMENGAAKPYPHYITFADVNHQNPKNWFAGDSLNDTCATIPSDYQVSGLITSFDFQQYCSVKSDDTEYVSIGQVKINDMINDSTAQSYANYWGKVAKVARNQTVNIKLTPNNPHDFDMLWNAWIDWNQDGDFNDASEHIIVQHDAVEAIDLNITVPDDAKPGLTKFRVNADWVGTDKPCIDIQLGEVEDYTIKVY